MSIENENGINRKEFTLSELNNRIKGVIYDAFPGACWLCAEMSDVRTNALSGHCYLEFIEKDRESGNTIAKARGSIWAKSFRMIKPYFEQTTGQTFSSGLKVLVKVSIEFHELYGYSLNVIDIDPAYTLGDMMKKRLEIIGRLKEEGVFTLNKELSFPMLPKRIAVITSSTAAGYEDFMNQLLHNKYGYSFTVKLFTAIMQGDKTENSVIGALEKIYEEYEKYDVVVIIRGGGATSDLNSFDSYLLATHCAQFPLPIITGIGHERDDTILDMVAHTRMKTPTAVAEFLIGKMDSLWEELSSLQQTLSQHTNDIITNEKNKLQLLTQRLPDLALNAISRNRIMMERVSTQLPLMATSLINRNRTLLEKISVGLPMMSTNLLQQSRRELDNIRDMLLVKTTEYIKEKEKSLELSAQFIKMASPEYILQRGYSLTLYNGKIIKEVSEVKIGDHITTKLSKGEITSIVYRK